MRASSDDAPRRGLDREGRYLRVAADLFLERGYDGVSLDEIVRLAGGSKTNLYTLFGDKEGLFVAVVERLCEDVLASVDDLDLSGSDLEEGLRTFATRLLVPLLQPRHIRFHRLVVAESARFPELGKAWYQAGPEESYRRIGAFIAELQRRGLVRDVEPRRAAVLFHDGLLYDALHRTMIGGEFAPTALEVERMVAEAVTMFVRAFGLPSRARGAGEA